ncbi:hypothetical protein [Agathobaculum sp.]|uniref:hypothetical protein n=1 Tax=Agathobaculum sp. TaxID=2048138 RepID=UPI001F89590B|nr:hypothetical protein [Candidatus Agathobaculum intestinigallinarum]
MVSIPCFPPERKNIWTPGAQCALPRAFRAHKKDFRPKPAGNHKKAGHASAPQARHKTGNSRFAAVSIKTGDYRCPSAPLARIKKISSGKPLDIIKRQDMCLPFYTRKRFCVPQAARKYRALALSGHTPGKAPRLKLYASNEFFRI